METPHPKGASCNLTTQSVLLLDGGSEAYPRMLACIDAAKVSVHLEVYAFALTGVGARFIEALSKAAQRGVKVQVMVDGWGAWHSGRTLEAVLAKAGCEVRIYNPLLAIFTGRLGRNHRKILLVDEVTVFLGGLNIGDEYMSQRGRLGWADLAIEIHGDHARLVHDMIHHRRRRAADQSLRVHLSGFGGGWRMRRRYLQAFRGAERELHIAHGYFLPDAGIIRALTAAARRGVVVRLLMAGRSDVPWARFATRSLYRQLMAAGVQIFEWERSILHAKVATIDGQKLLVGSFNLDPLSLVNLETLVEVDEPEVSTQAAEWVEEHIALSRVIHEPEYSTVIQRWFLDPIGYLVARAADLMGRILAS